MGSITEIQQFETYLDFLDEIKSSDRSLAELDSSEIDFLYEFAIESNSKACQMAKNVLTYFYGYDFGNNYLRSSPNKSKNQFNKILLADKPEIAENQIKIYPNPLSDKINVVFPNELIGSSVLILIKDIYGNNIFERKKIIESSLQELNIDVTFSGLVYISVQNDKNILYTCKAFKL
jgi:hypothetical protein